MISYFWSILYIRELIRADNKSNFYRSKMMTSAREVILGEASKYQDFKTA